MNDEKIKAIASVIGTLESMRRLEEDVLKIYPSSAYTKLVATGLGIIGRLLTEESSEEIERITEVSMEGIRLATALREKAEGNAKGNN